MKGILTALPMVLLIALPAAADSPFKVVYPPPNHETQAEQIFLIGTGPANAPVTVNGSPIESRSGSGHFAPSFPLQLGENVFTVQSQGQSITLNIKRLPRQVSPPTTLGFLPDSLEPNAAIARMPLDPICFKAIATPNAQVSVNLGGQTIPLQPLAQSVDLPPNSAVLTLTNQPQPNQPIGQYQGCTTFSQPGQLGQPQFTVSQGGQRTQKTPEATVTILDPTRYNVVEITAAQGVARTGPSTDYSRLTPLPLGTQARVTGRQGEWLRLDYGAWIKEGETRTVPRNSPPLSLIRSVRSRQISGWTEVIFPLQVPAPVTVEQNSNQFTLTLHNTTAQTDTIFINPDRIIAGMNWAQTDPEKVRYRLQLRSQQQWGYKLRYEGSSLILSLRHPPELSPKATSLAGTTILLDAGHGSENDLGSVGPTGYPEKDATLFVTKVLQQELEARGATVIMTREGDEDLYPQDRVDKINATEPTLVLSLHFNALPDNGDALGTQGVGMFWYHDQAQALAGFLHDYLIQKLSRDSYGVFWNNLALTRPSVSPSVLLELGFMINPEEFEWIEDRSAQTRLGKTLADGITEWLHRSTKQL